jgi:hypothetical protein
MGCMSKGICPYCHHNFWASRYHPGQRVCSSPECQRRRRADYHRKKLATDSMYREQCRHSQKKWRDRNPSYLKRYRARRRSRARGCPDRLRLSKELRRLADLIESNPCLDLPSLLADVLANRKMNVPRELTAIPQCRSCRWSEEDDRLLLNLAGCKTLSVIARILCRSIRTVRSRLAALEKTWAPLTTAFPWREKNNLAFD